MKKLYRSRKDRRIAGVCGGIAEYFNIDSTLVRIIFGIVLSLFVFRTFGTAVLVYFVLVLIIPSEPYQPDDEDIFYRSRNSSTAYRKDVTPK